MDKTLDETDLKIVRALIKDSRASLSEIAKELGIGTTTAYKRFKKLVDGQVIKGFTALVDNEKIGLNSTAFIGINCDNECKDDALKSLINMDEVVEIHDVLEPYDVFIKVRSTDLKALKRDVLDKILNIKGVTNVNTILVLKALKEGCYNDRSK